MEGNQERTGSSLPMTLAQAHEIIDFMAAHDLIAAGKAIGLDPKKVKNDVLVKLVEKVKTKGSTKTPEQIWDWWSRMKSKAKKHNAKRKLIKRVTVNLANKVVKENELYDKIIQVVGRSHGNGSSLMPEMGSTVKTESKTEPLSSQGPNVIVYNKKAVSQSSVSPSQMPSQTISNTALSSKENVQELPGLHRIVPTKE